MKTLLASLVIFAYVFICYSQVPDPDPSNTDWCDPLLCPKKGPHIGCDNTEKFDPTCINATFVNITPDCQKAIVDAHNYFRNIAAAGNVPQMLPKAARMSSLVWNPTLAYLASLNCLQCDMKHDMCRNTPVYPLSGQNLGMEKTLRGRENDCATLVQNRIKGWFNEVNYVQPDVIAKYRSQVDPNLSGYGHYTALIQDRSVQIGCSVCQYGSISGRYTMTSSLLACNYAQTNLIGDYVYKAGDAGSGCIKGTDPAFPNICSKDEILLLNPKVMLE